MSNFVSSRALLRACLLLVGLQLFALSDFSDGGLLSGGRLSAQPLYISEFMASNESTIRDQDGAFSDWIEIYNDSDQTVSLNGYFLTDDKLELNKWRFPNVSIPPKGFRLVFASDKDRVDPNAELHTNFKLTSIGEYLGLIEPDGETIAYEYDIYPGQVSDFSYGLSQNGQRFVFIDEGSTARAFVPTNGTLGDTWHMPGFNDSSWDSGQQGVGYDDNATYVPFFDLDVKSDMDGENESCFIRLAFDVADTTGLTGFKLLVRYDDGFAAYVNGVPVASANAPANPDWNSGATGQHDDGAAVDYEEFTFNLQPGDIVEGTNILAFHGLNSGLGSSDFLISAELSASSAGDFDPSQILYFPEATPGGGNVEGFDGVSETPIFSTSGTAFQGTTQVEITVDDEETIVRYTTDGSEPRESSPVADGPITVTSSTLVSARGFAAGRSPSPIVSEGFLRVDSTVQAATSNLPIFVIENFGRGGPGSSSFQPAFGVLFEPQNGRTRLTDAPTVQTRLGMKIRGSSTAGQAKKQYAMEIWDDKNEDRAQSLLGLPAEADWILYGGNSFDEAMVRNAFIFQLSNEIGAYAPRTEFCEVYFNQNGGNVSASDYIGVYVLTEKIERDKNRVDVNRLSAAVTSEPDISGGYMFKVDRRDPGDSGLNAGGHTLGWVYPKEEFATSAQATWLRNYINEFVSVLNSGNFRDPVNGYRKYIKIDEWIVHHVLNVMSLNADALRLSTYYHKDRNGPIVAGPVWDFDRSMGSSDGRDDNTSAWNGGTNYFAYPWWERLFEDPDFDQLWIDQWQEWRRGSLSNTAQGNLLSFFEQTLSEAGARNHTRWGWGNFRSDMLVLQNWLQARRTWMDSQLIAPPTVPNGRKIEPGFDLSITGSSDIYYTLDGTDPRRAGGGVSPEATRYTGAITLEGNVQVVARRRSGNRRTGDRPQSNWSGPIVQSFWVREPRIVISELMYHPPDPLADSGFDADDFEFVELFNAEDAPIDLEGFSFSGGIEFTFGPGPDLAPGDYVVVVSDLAAFEGRYGDGMRVAGEYSGNFGNSGDTIVFQGPLGEPIHNFAFSDQWIPETDGQGLSLVVLDPFEELNQWRVEGSWSGSSVVFGTPGEDDPGFGDLGGRQRPGDSNQDGLIDLSDALHLLRRLFVGGLTPPCDGDLESGGNLMVLDVSGDAGVDMSDAIFLVNYLFKGGAAPGLGQNCLRVQGCPSVTCGI